MNIKKIMYEQLAADLGCTTDDIESKKNIFICGKKLIGARAYESKFSLICINSKIVARSEDSKVVDWLTENYTSFQGEWLSDYKCLRKLDEGLKQFGISIDEFHPFFVPQERKVEVDFSSLKDSELKWYFEQELLQFKGDKRFNQALAFHENAPDMIAVTAEKDREVMTMAAANADSKTMWQIGINVMPGYEGRGLATAVVTLLKNKILEQGILPYYGTASSHIKSQRVAIKAGFLPAWSELSTKVIG